MKLFNTNLLAGAYTLLVAASCTNPKPEIPDQPNFIVFIADDASWNDCGPYETIKY